MKIPFQTLLVFILFIACSKDVEPEVIPKYNLKVSVTPIEGGTVTPSDGSYQTGTNVSLLGVPSPEYVFKEWNGGVTGTTNPISVTINSNKIITGVFEKRMYPLSIIIEGEGTVTEELLSSKPTKDYPSGSVVKLTAIPVDGWEFESWSGDYVGTENPINITVDKEKSITVEFSKKIITTEGLLSDYSELNKNTSWYKTNCSFDELFKVGLIKYRLFEIIEDGSIIPFIEPWEEYKEDRYYGFERGGYHYTDLTGDGYKDLWIYFLKNPWPSEEQGLHFFSEYEFDSNSYDIQLGLTQVRKSVLSDLNNDGKNEIILFSSGQDKPPFPGDSIGIFNVESKTYKYLTEDISYFHGGAVGDINNDGYNDILGYSNHPTLYLNNGDNTFELRNDIFTGLSEQIGYPTIELFDIDKDNQLDLFLGTLGKLHLVKQESGIYNLFNKIIIPIPSMNQPMDFDFFDFNNDGEKDILVLSNTNVYNGYSINIYIKENEVYLDKTSQYIDVSSESGYWTKWLYLFDYDKDGDVDIVSDGNYGISDEITVYWENNNGYFNKVIQ